MQEKLSVRKVYRNTCRYIAGHPFAFIFLTVFYFLGSLLPLFTGALSFKVLSLIYTYLFFYFAAGCYYKQQILWNRQIFIAAGIRFATAGILFFIALCMTTLAINFGIYFFKMTFSDNGVAMLDAVTNGITGTLGRYIVIFLLFTTFFIVPSFAFVSEITGKNRSLLMAYSKTKGSLLKISAAVLSAFIILIGVMLVLTHVNVILAAFFRAGVLTFICILYFKMYDYFYNIPQKKRGKQPVVKQDEIKNDEEGEDNAH